MTLHEKHSLETKNKLSASLKKLMQTSNFHKITVNALVKDAQLNRNSFYYHFNNILDLLKYTFENDTIKIVKQIDPSHNLKATICFIMDYIDQNKSFCACAYKSLGKTELRKFLSNNFQEIIINTIENVIKAHHLTISEDFKKYIIYSHTESMVIHATGYLENEFEFSKEQMANYILLLFNNSVVTSLEIADKYHL